LFADAVHRWTHFGSRLKQAHALQELGQSLLARGDVADEPLREAREMFASMGANPGVLRCDELLGNLPGTDSGSRAG